MKGYPIKDFLEQICKNKCENLLNRNQILKKNRRNNFERQTQKPLLSSTGWWLGEFTARRSMRDNQRNYFLKENLWSNLKKKIHETTFEKQNKKIYKNKSVKLYLNWKFTKMIKAENSQTETNFWKKMG